MSGGPPAGGRLLIPALGIAQIVSWGSLYYTLAVLGASMRAELNVEAPFLFGAFTAALITSAVLAPSSGRRVDRLGGRIVLSTGSIVAAAALLVLATCQGPKTLVAGYLLAGVAMSMTLYDPAFATLHRLRPETYRRAVTMLTLYGGLASTVFWPFASLLNEAVGWRASFAIFAVIHLAICLPLHLFAVPREAPHEPAAGRIPESRDPQSAGAAFYWLAASFALASLLSGALSAHLIEVLSEQGFTMAHAVLIGACIGPMQVAGRIFELAASHRTRAIHIGLACFALLGSSMVILSFAGASLALGIAFAAIYGMGNGIFTIVRGVAPREIFGTQAMGSLLGRLARIHLPAAALAPLAFALLRESGLRTADLLLFCALITCVAGFCFLAAIRAGPAGKQSS